MRSFRVEFDEFFQDDIISMIQVGLGPCGELRFPSCTVKHGWRYPGIGEFQVSCLLSFNQLNDTVNFVRIFTVCLKFAFLTINF